MEEFIVIIFQQHEKISRGDAAGKIRAENSFEAGGIQ